MISPQEKTTPPSGEYKLPLTIRLFYPMTIISTVIATAACVLDLQGTTGMLPWLAISIVLSNISLSGVVAHLFRRENSTETAKAQSSRK